MRELVQVGCERNGSAGKAKVIGFPTSFISGLREIDLPPIRLVITMPKMACTWGINRRNDDASLARFINRGVHVWIRQVTGSVVAIDAVAHHENFAAIRTGRPFF